tara:strand:+ start:62 stop:298 length:237 start_codon:yes stop_codon:yes gene_type:complete
LHEATPEDETMTEAQTTETSPKARIITNGDWCGCGDATCKFDTFQPITDAEDLRWEHPGDVCTVDGVLGCYVESCTIR